MKRAFKATRLFIVVSTFGLLGCGMGIVSDPGSESARELQTGNWPQGPCNQGDKRHVNSDGAVRDPSQDVTVGSPCGLLYCYCNGETCQWPTGNTTKPLPHTASCGDIKEWTCDGATLTCQKRNQPAPGCNNEDPSVTYDWSADCKPLTEARCCDDQPAAYCQDVAKPARCNQPPPCTNQDPSVTYDWSADCKPLTEARCCDGQPAAYCQDMPKPDRCKQPPPCTNQDPSVTYDWSADCKPMIEARCCDNQPAAYCQDVAKPARCNEPAPCPDTCAAEECEPGAEGWVWWQSPNCSCHRDDAGTPVPGDAIQHGTCPGKTCKNTCAAEKCEPGTESWTWWQNPDCSCHRNVAGSSAPTKAIRNGTCPDEIKPAGPQPSETCDDNCAGKMCIAGVEGWNWWQNPDCSCHRDVASKGLPSYAIQSGTCGGRSSQSNFGATAEGAGPEDRYGGCSLPPGPAPTSDWWWPALLGLLILRRRNKDRR